MASVFTKIIQGELPSYKIHEDDLTFSFLALDQVNLGHVLVIPKQEVNHWFDTPVDAFTRVQLNSQKIAKAIKAATDCPRVGVMVAGFEVPHYHVHLIPAWSIPDLDFKKARRFPDAEMKAIQEKIISLLKHS
ncbi:MAG: HIT family hydrolase [Bdellovibrionales bacterium RIFCSPHIGHO2_01_FULL_40_29]|nr:MAG: HIT family hydrolase [Bdellovibrionales bacterium RIFCSPHIGHO2_01_FULL_40_29]OFZ34092.1 MAG: HIT family hydrolase [Bdellovibrionales bacterium RIFCSPHIGHO2_02_FULL_40_15]